MLPKYDTWNLKKTLLSVVINILFKHFYNVSKTFKNILKTLVQPN